MYWHTHMKTRESKIEERDEPSYGGKLFRKGEQEGPDLLQERHQFILEEEALIDQQPFKCPTW